LPEGIVAQKLPGAVEIHEYLGNVDLTLSDLFDGRDMKLPEGIVAICAKHSAYGRIPADGVGEKTGEAIAVAANQPAASSGTSDDAPSRGTAASPLNVESRVDHAGNATPDAEHDHSLSNRQKKRDARAEQNRIRNRGQTGKKERAASTCASSAPSVSTISEIIASTGAETDGCGPRTQMTSRVIVPPAASAVVPPSSSGGHRRARHAGRSA